MESKYYTPNIEELYVGFECEVKTIPSGEWISWVLSTHDVSVDENHKAREHAWYFWLKNNSVRVKYLDKEDIESLGWELTYESENYSSWQRNDNWYLTKDTSYGFSIAKASENESNNFRMTIKNKSELKKLMQQLNIL